MKNKLLTLLVLLLIFTLCGCNGYKEPDSRYMVSALGIKFDKKYTVYAETVSIGTDIATADPRLFSYTADSLDSAFEGIKGLFSKEIMLEHCAAVVLEKDVKKDILSFCLNKGINPSACVVVCDDIKKLLSSSPERSAVGYDIMGIVRKEKLDNTRLFKVLSDNLSVAHFKSYGDAVGVIKNKSR